jgi:5'-methylthioadenosine phosphorylase
VRTAARKGEEPDAPRASRLGLLAGTGVEALPFAAEPLDIETPYGDVPIAFGRAGSVDIFFVPRHGSAKRPAHKIDHRANVDALARCKVDRVVALHSVGALDPAIATPSLLVPDDWIDLRGDKPSFFDDAPVHVDVSEPFCPEVRRALLAAAPDARDGGAYAATEGPRLETRAEIRALRQLGGAVVGMTAVPEATLARERGLCYASLCLVTNPAAGVAEARVDAERIRAVAREMAPRALAVALDAAARLPAAKGCACARALDAARL